MRNLVVIEVPMPGLSQRPSEEERKATGKAANAAIQVFRKRPDVKGIIEHNMVVAGNSLIVSILFDEELPNNDGSRVK